ncbi:15298_t:CDS:2, partial [Dentiscutata heterogama]
CHSGLVDHSELIFKLSNLRLPQLPSPSFESMFISGGKSFLAILNDREQNKAVFKASNSNRSKEVIFGKIFKNSWEDYEFQ